MNIFDPPAWKPAPAFDPAAEKPSEVCQSCRWWVRWSHQPANGEVLGECRKRSPKTYMRTTPSGTESPITKWPSTKSTDFCGEWKRRQEEPK